MDELIAFLRARLDEDEATAKAVAHGPWHWEGGYPQRVSNAAAILIAECYTSPDAPVQEAEHIARHDPARVLADVEADRALLEKFSFAREILPGAYKLGYCEALEEVIAIRAARFSGHPDYRPDWRAVT